MVETLGEYVEKLLEDAGVSHRQASRAAGLSDNVINQIVNGRVTSPDPETLRRIANRWGTEQDYFEMMRLAGHAPTPVDYQIAEESEVLDYYRELNPRERRLLRLLLKLIVEDRDKDRGNAEEK